CGRNVSTRADFIVIRVIAGILAIGPASCTRGSSRRCGDRSRFTQPLARYVTVVLGSPLLLLYSAVPFLFSPLPKFFLLRLIFSPLDGVIQTPIPSLGFNSVVCFEMVFYRGLALNFEFGLVRRVHMELGDTHVDGSTTGRCNILYCHVNVVLKKSPHLRHTLVLIVAKDAIF